MFYMDWTKTRELLEGNLLDAIGRPEGRFCPWRCSGDPPLVAGSNLSTNLVHCVY